MSSEAGIEDHAGERLLGRIGTVAVYVGEVTAPVPQPDWAAVLAGFEDPARAPISVTLSASTYERLREHCERRRPDLLPTLPPLDEES